ncbi:hypothetical protein V5799_014791 [Amblyomma americanum]|uniref:Uncharacterized protein n=1 Tax=Amblyomma americanum TaxID=6943 RepID=A0AAQ4E205_AMBAM
MLDTAKKGPQESWRQFDYRLRSYYSYYISSRKVTETEELMELVVVDKLKEALPNDALRQIALQNKSWLKIGGLTEVVEAVESSRGKPSGASVPRMAAAAGAQCAILSPGARVDWHHTRDTLGDDGWARKNSTANMCSIQRRAPGSDILSRCG